MIHPFNHDIAFRQVLREHTFNNNHSVIQRSTCTICASVPVLFTFCHPLIRGCPSFDQKQTHIVLLRWKMVLGSKFPLIAWLVSLCPPYSDYGKSLIIREPARAERYSSKVHHIAIILTNITIWGAILVGMFCFWFSLKKFWKWWCDFFPGSVPNKRASLGLENIICRPGHLCRTTMLHL